MHYFLRNMLELICNEPFEDHGLDKDTLEWLIQLLLMSIWQITKGNAFLRTRYFKMTRKMAVTDKPHLFGKSLTHVLDVLSL